MQDELLLYALANQEFKKLNNKIDAKDIHLTKIDDYLYKADFDNIDYDYGYKYFNNNDVIAVFGACSGIRAGDIFARNYDWLYDNAVEFIVRVPAIEGRHASIGVSSMNEKFTPNIMADKPIKSYAKAIPFLTLDGMNDAGLTVSTNVVPAGDKGHTTEQDNPTRIYNLMVVRYLLDHAATVDEAIDLFTNELSVYAKDNIELHWLIADANKTYIVEYTDNELQVITNNEGIMTNFYHTDWDGQLITGFDEPEGILPTDTTLTAHAEGIERYEILRAAKPSIADVASARSAMAAIKYTNTYGTPFWYSEAVGNTEKFGDLTIYQNKSEFDDIEDYMKQLYIDRTRDNPKTWQTVHNSIYDLKNKTLTVWTQEEDEVKFNGPAIQYGTETWTITFAGGKTVTKKWVTEND